MTAFLDTMLLAAGEAAPFPPMLISLVLIFALFYFMMIRPEQRKQREHKALLEALKKNDRVVTAGGIYGVVTNVQRDSNEVTIKVDEANNTKLRVTISSIARVVTTESSEEKSG